MSNQHNCCEEAEDYLHLYDGTIDKSEGEKWRFEQDCGIQGPEIVYCPFCGEKLPGKT